MRKPYIFISESTKDAGVVSGILAELKLRSYQRNPDRKVNNLVWRSADKSIPSGESSYNKIFSVINSCSKFLVCLSRNSQKSLHVAKEYLHFYTLNKKDETKLDRNPYLLVFDEDTYTQGFELIGEDMNVVNKIIFDSINPISCYKLFGSFYNSEIDRFLNDVVYDFEIPILKRTTWFNFSGIASFRVREKEIEVKLTTYLLMDKLSISGQKSQFSINFNSHKILYTGILQTQHSYQVVVEVKFYWFPIIKSFEIIGLLWDEESNRGI